MRVPPKTFSCHVLCGALLACFACLSRGGGEVSVRYLRFEEVQETLRLNADSGIPGSDIAESGAWDAWIRSRDAEVRSRIDRGIEDSISNLILYGTSFTSLPLLERTSRSTPQSTSSRRWASTDTTGNELHRASLIPRAAFIYVRGIWRRSGIFF